MSAAGDRVNQYIAAVVAAGTIVTAAALAAAVRDGSIERPATALGFLALMAVMERLPLFMLREQEGEGLDPAEVFLVALPLLLEPADALAIFIIGMVLGEVARSAPLRKMAFNVSQFALSGSVAILTMNAIGDLADAGPRTLAAVVVGAGVYFCLNTVVVSGVISASEGTPFIRGLLHGIGMRTFVWAANLSLGLLVGLTGAAHSWAIPFAIAPVGMLHLAFAGHLRARRAHERMDGLFRTAVAAHSSMGVDQVLGSLADSARQLLRCNTARIDERPPGHDELGVTIPGTGDRRWLVVAHRRGVEPFVKADRDLLEAIAAIGATALDNAALYQRVGSEGQKLANILASSSDGIFSVDADQRVQAWNPAMERITGLRAAQVVGGSCTVFDPRDEHGARMCPDTCPGRCGFHGEPVPMQVIRPTGEVRWLDCTYSPMPAGGYVVVVRDVTAQKEVDDLKADFLATVSHELRTPLTPIKGFLATLRERDAEFEPEQRTRLYEVMQRQADRLERLVSDLLDATSMERHQQLFLSEELQWDETAARVVELFARQEPDRDVELACAPAIAPVVADEQRAEQVLANLLSNAAKYSPPGTAIRVAIEQRDSEVVTTVVDSGPGIDPGQRSRIFERFTRLGDYRTRTSGGAGLGLFIAKRLVEGMGGTISVDDAPDGGAAFTFTLPALARAEHNV